MGIRPLPKLTGGVLLDKTNVVANVARFDPVRDSTPHFHRYSVTTDVPISVMTLVTRIHEQDPTFACRTSQCFHGTCLSCLIRVNGKDVRGCEVLVHPGEEVIIEPHSRYEIIRDAVVDFTVVKTGQEE